MPNLRLIPNIRNAKYTHNAIYTQYMLTVRIMDLGRDLKRERERKKVGEFHPPLCNRGFSHS